MADDKKAKKDKDADKDARPGKDAKGGAKVTDDGDEAEGGEGAVEGVENEGGGRRFNVKKIALFVGVPLLVLIAGVIGAYFMGYLDKLLPKKEIDCSTVVEGDANFVHCAEQLAQAANNMTPGVFIEVPSMIVNLSSTSKQPRFLKVTLKVEIENRDDQKNFEAVMPRVVDQFQSYLRELRIEDLRGSSGMYRMKLELLSRVRAAAPDIKVRDVLFQEILVQ